MLASLGLFALFLLSYVFADVVVAEDAPSHTRCVSTFVRYTSSRFEQKWIDNVQSWQEKVCDHMSNDEMSWWLGNVSALMNDNDGSSVATDSETPPHRPWSWVFPTFTYLKKCMHKTDGSTTSEYVHIPIEPTAGLGRDPRKVSETEMLSCELSLTTIGFVAVLGHKVQPVHSVQGVPTSAVL